MDDVKLPWYIDLLNINLNNSDLNEAKRRIRMLADAFRKDGTRITENLDFSAVSCLSREASPGATRRIRESRFSTGGATGGAACARQPTSGTPECSSRGELVVAADLGQPASRDLPVPELREASTEEDRALL